tara:strand:+ start:245 stop:427 length:183 start_codon:yes stop_codon:yes gene_type:complete
MKSKGKKPKFGIVGKRSMKEIQKEINYLYELDKQISNRVRASYAIPLKLQASIKEIHNTN